MSRRWGGDGVCFRILNGDGALMELIFFYGAVMVFNFKNHADLYRAVQATDLIGVVLANYCNSCAVAMPPMRLPLAELLIDDSRMYK